MLYKSLITCYEEDLEVIYFKKALDQKYEAYLSRALIPKSLKE